MKLLGRVLRIIHGPKREEVAGGYICPSTDRKKCMVMRLIVISFYNFISFY
jgi:hypothetical protein